MQNAKQICFNFCIVKLSENKVLLSNILPFFIYTIWNQEVTLMKKVVCLFFDGFPFIIKYAGMIYHNELR